MQVLFKARSTEALALRDVAVSRIEFALRRLRWMSPRAHVHLEDVNGPRGGVDKRCRIELRAPAGQPVVVTSMANDWRRALDAAMASAVRALLKWWQRQRSRTAVVRRLPSH